MKKENNKLTFQLSRPTSCIFFWQRFPIKVDSMIKMFSHLRRCCQSENRSSTINNNLSTVYICSISRSIWNSRSATTANYRNDQPWRRSVSISMLNRLPVNELSRLERTLYRCLSAASLLIWHQVSSAFSPRPNCATLERRITMTCAGAPTRAQVPVI